MSGFSNKIRNLFDRTAGRLAEQLFTHLATFIIFLLIVTASFGWFLFRGQFHTLSFFHEQADHPPVSGIVFPDGRVGDLEKMVIVTLETPGEAITGNPEAVGAFFSVMARGEGMPELKRFLSPFVHGLPGWDGTPEELAARATDLTAVYLDRDGTRLKGYFEIGQGSSATEIRLFGRWARAVLSQEGKALVVIPPLVPLLYRQQIFNGGGLLLAAGVLLSFLMLFVFTRNLKFSLPASFVAPMAVFWSLGFLSKVGPPLVLESLFVIPLLFVLSLVGSLRFWSLYTGQRAVLEETPGPRERFRRLTVNPLKETFLFWLMMVPLTGVAFAGGSKVLSLALFLLLGTVLTGFVSLLVLPMSVLNMPENPRPLFFLTGRYRAGLLGAGLLLAGLIPLVTGVMQGPKLLPRIPEITDFLIWFGKDFSPVSRARPFVFWPGAVTGAAALVAGIAAALIPVRKRRDLP